MFLGKIKKSEKLPRGTFLYIRVGDRFYAGEAAVIQETKVVPAPSYLRASPKPTGARHWRYGCGSTTRIERRLASYFAKRDGRPVPKYWLEPEKEPDPTKKSVTGKRATLTDEFKDVKKFRTLVQAEAACERLNTMYDGLGIRIAIELHEGDK